MTPPEERLAMGRVASLTFGVIGRNAAAIALLFLAVAALTVGLDVGVKAGLVAAFPNSYGPRGEEALHTGVTFVVSCVTYAGVTRVAIDDLDGRRIGAGQALVAGLRLALPVLAFNVVMSLAVGLATLLLVVPGIMLAVRWAMAVPVRVVDGLSINNSTRRSSELTAGSRWRIFGLFTVLYTGIVAVVVLAILAGGSSLFASMPSPVTDAITDIASDTFMAGLAAVLAAVCYAELRRIREGATPGQVAAVFA